MRLGFSFLFLLLVMAGSPVFASDPLRLQEGFGYLDLEQYVHRVDDGYLEFSIQNGGNEDLQFIVQRYPPSDISRALGVARDEFQPLRLFASDDSEFAAPPHRGERLRFSVPVGAVITYYLSGASQERLYLWSPTALDAFDERQSTMRIMILLILLFLFAVGAVVTIQRRSRRAGYALIMGLGLMILLVSVWAQTLVTGSRLESFFASYRSVIILSAFIFWLIMLAVGHLNLIIRIVPHRPYWTQVIIAGDICLLVTVVFWSLSLFNRPDFAGVISNDLIDVTFSLSCMCVLLGAVFVPDRLRPKNAASQASPPS